MVRSVIPSSVIGPFDYGRGNVASAKRGGIDRAVPGFAAARPGATPSSIRARSLRSPLDTWREWANDVPGAAIDCGHYLPEENPQATAAALLAFFAGR